ncbi:MAG: ACP phosphodiesterase [Planctomycetota bacterium]
MNYLAHLVIAEGLDANACFVAGSLLPDFVRGRLEGLRDEVARGVVLHRWVDRVTDADPVAARTRETLRKTHGRFAGVIADVLYDHCLARRFERWRGESSAVAIERYHARIREALPDMPATARPGLTRLIEAGWMRRYAELEGIRWVLGLMEHRLTHRFGRSVRLSHAADTYHDHQESIESDFEAFFGGLLTRAASEADRFAPGTPPTAEAVA